MPQDQVYDVLIIGAGPAGLTAGYALARAGKNNIGILEADPVYVGGISRTEKYKGFSFDIGGHRFFSKSEEIVALWKEIMPRDFLERSRLSRIYYQGKFYAYPLKAFQALMNLGIIESFLCMASYARAKLFPNRNPRSFTDWVSNQFGKRLFQTFFQTYTEKVWGMKCDAISADWAAQRIKGLNLVTAVLSGLPLPFRKKKVIKTLIDAFHYPRLGPGMMWETAADKIKSMGGALFMDQTAIGYAWKKDEGVWEVTATNAAKETTLYRAKHLISSAPLRDTLQVITPKPRVSSIAARLTYRDFITVALMLKKAPSFTDNWIYIHDPSVLVGRVQNFSAWSPDMVPEIGMGCLGLEYFCFENDALWNQTDADLILLAKDELHKLGLVDLHDVIDGRVVRQKKAYPIYDDNYNAIIETIRLEFCQNYPTFHFVGRNGMHKYDNQDHAMMTALLAARNIIHNNTAYDVWAVNEDATYHEEVRAP